jgi:hypothetical protein
MALSRNVKHPGYYGFGGAHFVKHPTPGDVFYVTDAARGGSNDNDGLTPATPFLTITYALTQLTGLRDSYIFVQRTTLASETWPITVTQAYLHLIGTPDQGSPTPAIRPQDNNHGLQIDAGGCEIAGFIFSATAANQDACIYVGSAGQQWQTHIHHNFFAWDSEAYDCIYLDNQACQTRIHDNYFGAHGFDRYGITCDTNVGVERTIIEDNVFIVDGRIVTGSEGIHLWLNSTGVITGNYFACPDSAVGEAIHITPGAGGQALITGNYAMSGVGAAMGNNPYQDEDDRNHWGLNYDNQTARLPAS